MLTHQKLVRLLTKKYLRKRGLPKHLWNSVICVLVMSSNNFRALLPKTNKVFLSHLILNQHHFKNVMMAMQCSS